MEGQAAVTAADIRASKWRRGCGWECPPQEREQAAEAQNTKKGRTPNPQEFVRMFPTPTTGAGLCGGTGNYRQLQQLADSGQITEDERRSMSQGNGGQLNPAWVEWLMGFPFGWTDANQPHVSPEQSDSQWDTEPDISRIIAGVPDRARRLKCLGNAVVPYQTYPIFRAIAQIQTQPQQRAKEREHP